MYSNKWNKLKTKKFLVKKINLDLPELMSYLQLRLQSYREQDEYQRHTFRRLLPLKSINSRLNLLN